MTTKRSTTEELTSPAGYWEPVVNRLLDRIIIDPATECWLWPGSTDGYGYGTIRFGARPERTHRVTFGFFRGPIPAGLDLDHQCHNADAACPGGPRCSHRRCCNPWHVEPASRIDNVRNGRGHGSETHCPQGHPYDEANTYVPPRNPRERQCRTCNRDRARRKAIR